MDQKLKTVQWTIGQIICFKERDDRGDGHLLTESIASMAFWRFHGESNFNLNKSAIKKSENCQQ